MLLLVKMVLVGLISSLSSLMPLFRRLRSRKCSKLYTQLAHACHNKMDAACITVAAAHKKMLITAGGLGGMAANGADQDEDAAVAAKCNMIATTQFEPLANVMSMKEW